MVALKLLILILEKIYGSLLEWRAVFVLCWSILDVTRVSVSDVAGIV